MKILNSITGWQSEHEQDPLHGGAGYLVRGPHAVHHHHQLLWGKFCPQRLTLTNHIHVRHYLFCSCINVQIARAGNLKLQWALMFRKKTWKICSSWDETEVCALLTFSNSVFSWYSISKDCFTHISIGREEDVSVENLVQPPKHWYPVDGIIGIQ